MTSSPTIAAAILFASLAFPALAQQSAPGATKPMPPAQTMPGMPKQETAMAVPGANASPSTKAFKAADAKMMKDMDRLMTGDADQDFVGGMLPHHEGAVDMARVEIQYGKDREMLKLARGIVAAQEKEIAQMKAWQARHPKP